MRSSYSIPLVLLSYVVAALASHVTLSLALRLRPIDGAPGAHRPLHWPWIAGGAFSMGAGIWSMHFIGMLAFHLPIQVVYDLRLTATSYAIAVVVSGVALHSFHRNDTTVRGIALPGAFIGFGISAMHYTGMAAMRMSPGIYYDPLLFATSVLIAIGAAVAALWIAFSLPQGQRGKSWHKLAAASVMGAAIVGMHYTGMAAANFAPDAVCISSGPRLDATWLAITISAFTFLILGSTLLLSVIDAQLQSTIARSATALSIVNEELEQRVLDRTVQLELVNHTLQAEIGARQRTEQNLQAQLARLNLLQHITRAIGERQNIRSVFQAVIRTLEEHLPVDFCCVCLHDPVDNCLVVTSVGLNSEALAMQIAMTEQARVEIDGNGLLQCVRGQLVYEPDVTLVPFPFPRRLAGGALSSMVAAPLVVESKVFGVLIGARRQAHGFSTGDCEFLRQVSEHVALAAHQAQLYSALQQAYDDLRQTQKAVMQQERLLALGQMSSGIAHDINNAISPVVLYTESLLERESGLSPRARGYLETIRRAIDDVAQTVARMREFHRQRELQFTLVPVDMNRLIQQVVDLTRARWSDMAQQRGIAIEMRTELAADLPAIMGADNEIREALTNLIFNAVDAMPNGGPLTLRTQVVQDKGFQSREQEARKFVQVEVIDAGIGMDEDTQRRCLEPFFTTKGERGTGLGLAMVYGTMQRHSADIEIESAVGEGTTVRFSFAIPSTPAVDMAVSATASDVPPLRVLVVDDDPLVLKSLREALEADGHGVTTADGGQAGIDAFVAALAQGNPFPVVITDLGMPYVDGRKVSSAVKSAAPGTIVLMVTGWGQRMVAEGDCPPHVDRVLSKPPRMRELRETLVQCLDARAT